MKILAFICLLGVVALVLAKRNSAPPAVQKQADTEAQKIAKGEQARRDAEAYTELCAEAERMDKDFQKDQRKPIRENISGYWIIPGMSCSSFQMEQDGEKVTGRGYERACLGISGTFQLTGTYRDGILELTRTGWAGRTRPWKMKFVQENGYPRFDEMKDGWMSFIAHYELVETRGPVGKN